MIPTLARFVCSAILAGAVLISSPAVVLAQDGGGDGSELRKAQAYLTLAGDLFRSKDYEGALTELRRAESLVIGSDVHPLVRFNIARCLEELGRAGESYRAYERYLELNDSTTARREKARTAIERLRADAFGTLRVTCVQAGTALIIPALGEAARECPFEKADILIGDYVLAAAFHGYEGATQTVTVRGGQTTDVRFDLVKKVVAPSAVSASRPINWGLVGSGIGVAAVGIAFHVMAFQTMEKHDEMVVANQKLRDEILDDFGTQRTIAYAAYGLSAALIGFGYYLSTKPAASAGGVSVTASPMGLRVEF